MWDDCIISNREPSHKYARIDVGGKMMLLHVAAYIAEGGEIPEGHVVDHLCSTKRCRNTKHLEPVTRAENTQRMYERGERPLKTHCPRGHIYSTRIDKNGHRSPYCQTCRSEATRRHRGRKPR